MGFQCLKGVAPLLLLAIAGGAEAQDTEERFPKVTGFASFVSDYRFRGISFSDLDPAPQASITLATRPGFFFTAWGSSIADFNGATAEIDLTGGWSGSVGPFNTSLGVIGYLYPGGTGTDYVELYGSVGGALGPVTATVGINVAPDQSNLSRSSRYLYGSLVGAIPNTPVTLKGTIGHERGGLVIDESGRTTQKLDWLIGADVTFAPLTFGIAYVGTDLPRTTVDFGDGPFRTNRIGRDGIVLSVTAAF